MGVFYSIICKTLYRTLLANPNHSSNILCVQIRLNVYRHVLRPCGGFIDIKCMWYLSIYTYTPGALWKYQVHYTHEYVIDLFIFSNSRTIKLVIIGRMSPFRRVAKRTAFLLDSNYKITLCMQLQSNCNITAILQLPCSSNSSRVTTNC